MGTRAASLSAQDLQPEASPAQRFTPRPSFGKEGRAIQIRANCYQLTQIPKGNIIHYDVTILPDIPASLGRLVFRQLEVNKVWKADIRAVYDGRKNMYAPRRIPDLSKEPKEFSVTVQEEEQGEQRVFQVIIKEVAEINMEELHRYINGQLKTYTPHTAIHALDVLFRHKPSMYLSSFGRSLFTDDEKQPLGGGLNLWKGYFQSVRPAAGKLILNLDLSVTSYYESGPCLDVLAQVLGRRDASELDRPLNSNDIQRAEKFFKGVRVQVNYRGAMRRKYRVIGITPLDANRSTFFNESLGQDQSVAAFFSSTYNVKLQFPHLPCFRVGNPQRKIMIPMEVCDLIPGQRYPRRLNENQTANMIKVASMRPDMRMNTINDGYQLMKFSDNEYLKDFGVSVDKNMMMVPARVLDAPRLVYSDRSQEARFVPRDGGWNLRDKMVPVGATISSWSVVAFGSQREFDQRQVESFITEFVKSAISTGLTIEDKYPSISWGSPLVNVEQTLITAYQRAKQGGRTPQIIMCLLPGTGVPLYAEIKRVGETVLGIPTQCVQGRHTRRPNRQYCANVALKINAKLGGSNVFVEKLPFVGDAPTIVFGADVTHPAPGDGNKPSICAVVGSLDPQASRYASAIHVQTSRQEIIGNLKNMVADLMRQFFISTQRKPARIIFYRDGVSEGQFHEVVYQEVSALRAACEELEPGYHPTITFLVVQKRHHTRLFPASRADADRNGNVLPGTVVDSGITSPTEFDFFLCSHGSILGTSRPTHYHVLFDENNFSPDVLQRLTYHSCYLFARSTRSVSLCPPAYYADLLAFRAKFHSKGAWDDSTQSERSDQMESSFSPVKAELRNRLYFV